MLTSIWHFSLPVLDDTTDLWLLLAAFGGGHSGLWWTCLCVFVIADIERVYTAFFLLALLLKPLLFAVFWVVSGGLFDFVDWISFIAGQRVDACIVFGFTAVDLRRSACSI